MPLGASGARRITLRRPRLKFRDSFPLELGFTRYAAVCRAVAAADLRAACARAFASFWAQSGRTLSVVITLGSVADKEVARRRPTTAAAFPDERDDVDERGEEKFGREVGSEA